MHSPAQRRKLRRFLIVKEIIIVGLAVISVVGLAYEHIKPPTHEEYLLYEIFEVIVGCIFLAEFAFETYYAKDRRKYIAHHWLFLFAAVPIPTGTFELLRGLRIVRLVKVFKVFESLRYEYNTYLFEHDQSQHR